MKSKQTRGLVWCPGFVGLKSSSSSCPGILYAGLLCVFSCLLIECETSRAVWKPLLLNWSTCWDCSYFYSSPIVHLGRSWGWWHTRPSRTGCHKTCSWWTLRLCIWKENSKGLQTNFLLLCPLQAQHIKKILFKPIPWERLPLHRKKDGQVMQPPVVLEVKHRSSVCISHKIHPSLRLTRSRCACCSFSWPNVPSICLGGQSTLRFCWVPCIPAPSCGFLGQKSCGLHVSQVRVSWARPTQGRQSKRWHRSLKRRSDLSAFLWTWAFEAQPSLSCI